LISIFVIVLYGTVICCSFWVNLVDYSFTWDNWKVVSRDGLGALGATMETSLIAAPITALFSMIIAYLVVKKQCQGAASSSSSRCWPWRFRARFSGSGSSAASSKASSIPASCRGSMGRSGSSSSSSSSAPPDRDPKRDGFLTANRQIDRGKRLRYGRQQLQGLHDVTLPLVRDSASSPRSSPPSSAASPRFPPSFSWSPRSKNSSLTSSTSSRGKPLIRPHRPIRPF
jgi:hypothetical protein